MSIWEGAVEECIIGVSSYVYYREFFIIGVSIKVFFYWRGHPFYGVSIIGDDILKVSIIGCFYYMGCVL